MTPEDDARHFQAWMDKNSWRRDIARLEHDYGAARAHEPKLGRPERAGCRPYTDEFTVPVMDVIHHLLEAFLFVPRSGCSRCGAEIRVSRNDRGPRLCTVDSMLDSL